PGDCRASAKRGPMSEQSESSTRIAAFPAGSRVLHIGQPKTATTALQVAASTQRDRLRALGVVYPGRGLNHNRATSAIMRRVTPFRPQPLRIAEWQELLAEIARTPEATALISYENVGESDEAAARRFAADLG